MLTNIILIFVCVIMGIFAVCAFLMAQAARKDRYNAQKALDEVYEHAEKTAEIITEANKTKEDARTGNHERDFNFMANKLHNLASK